MSDIFGGSTRGNGHGQIPVRQACTVLYNALPPLDAAAMQPSLEVVVGPCAVEWSAIGPAGKAVLGGLAQFGDHRIAMVALEAAVRQEVLDVTVGVSPMPDTERASLTAHHSAIRLLYIGDDPDPVAQLTALYSVAGVLLKMGGLGIINERAALAVPTALAETYLAQLGAEVPPISLWTGVVTYGMGETASPAPYLMRTYGMDQCALPELSMWLNDRAHADDAYHAIMNVCLHLVQGRPNLEVNPGDRVEFNARTYLITDPNNNAPEFASDSGMLLLIEV